MSADPREVGDKLAAAYCEIYRTAMTGLPICNDALAVEAIGFRNFQEHILGIIITPWFLNMAAVERGAACAAVLNSSPTSVRVSFPAGNVEFDVVEIQGFGRFASCSLFSPMVEFSDQNAARQTAQAALGALFDSHLREDSVERPASGAAVIDRRALLGGRWRQLSQEVAS
jgi:[NiFe] hydrogenase assembly HybE family chaperone